MTTCVVASFLLLAIQNRLSEVGPASIRFSAVCLLKQLIKIRMKKGLLATVALLSGISGVWAQNIIKVDADATGNNDGSTWTNAYVNLQDALDVANSTDTLWIAEGVYLPTTDIMGDANPTIAQNKSFHWENKVLYVYGGFDGTETTLSERDWETNLTVLSGDLGIQNDNTDNAATVLQIDQGGASILSGLTISDGTYSSVYGIGNGGLKINYCVEMMLENCIISNNIGLTGGSQFNSSALILKECVFHDNSASEGGSFYAQYCNIYADRSTFYNNSSSAHGGNITFNGSWGGIPNLFSNCLFHHNTAGTITGGALFFYNVAPGSIITNCSFVENEAPNGAAIGSNGAAVDVYNSIFWGTSANTQLHESNGNLSILSVENSIVKNGYATGNNILVSDPVFVDELNNDFTLSTTSPGINAGDTTGISGLITLTDLNGNDRYVGTIDLGCYEEYCGITNNTTTSTYVQDDVLYLTVTPSGSLATYQWLDCDDNYSVINGLNGNGFSVSQNGSYACMITDGCATDTTACVVIDYLGMEENAPAELRIYPNPTTNTLHLLNAKGVASIVDPTGKIVLQSELVNQLLDVSSLANGMYLLQLETEQGCISTRFVKE